MDWKKAVVRYHAKVPFHLLREMPALSCGGEAAAGNIIVQGMHIDLAKMQV